MNPAASFLLVDDDPIFLAVAESIVSSLGDHRIVLASDGAAGIEALRTTEVPFDCIILDLNMPGVDGLAFLRAVATAGFRGNVIISSGEAVAVLRSARMMGELLGVRVLGALKKPLSAPDLVALLEKAAEPVPPKPRTNRINPTGDLSALELMPYYQAQHDMTAGSIRGIEALIRARSPDGQIHGPGKLFGLIQNHAELLQTTLTIAGKVLDDLKSWQDQGIACRTAINLDAKITEDPELGPALVAMTMERGIDPGLVCLELTETALPNDMARLIEVLARLRIAGFHLALDDYGTGSSNFELLRLCPFTEVKIDGSIIRSALSEPIARSFIRSTAMLAQELSIDLVGEGVETAEHLALARSCGVHIIQGFLLSIPVPADDCRSMLAGRPMLRQAG